MLFGARQTILAKGKEGFVIAQISQHRRHDIGLREHVGRVKQALLPSFVEEDDGHLVQPFGRLVLGVGEEVGMVGCEHKEGIAVPSLPAGIVEEMA